MAAPHHGASPSRLRAMLWLLAGIGLGVLSTLNICSYRCSSCAQKAPEAEVLAAMNKARYRLQLAMNQLKTAHKVQNVVTRVPTVVPPRPPVVKCEAKNVSMMASAQQDTSHKKDADSFFILGLVMHVERSIDYLHQALSSLADSELRSASNVIGAPCAIFVYDASPRPSSQFIAQRKRYAEDPLFLFGAGQKSKPMPKSNTARQARDVAAAIRMILNRHTFDYAMLLEDDWLVCRGILSSLVLGLEAAVDTHGTKLAGLRLSYGLNGVIVPTAQNKLESLAHFIDAKASAMPPDHAFTKWATSAGRVLVTFRHNTFVHVGKQSSIGNSGDRWNAACYELLYDWLQRDTEAFQIHQCAHSVISPCKPKAQPHARASSLGGILWPSDNPVPTRRHKAFNCDVALQDFPAYRASARLLTCLRNTIPGIQPPANKIVQNLGRRRR